MMSYKERYNEMGNVEGRKEWMWRKDMKNRDEGEKI